MLVIARFSAKQSPVVNRDALAGDCFVAVAPRNDTHYFTLHPYFSGERSGVDIFPERSEKAADFIEIAIPDDMFEEFQPGRDAL